MNTYAIQMVLHFQDSSENDHRFDEFLGDVKDLADRHGISFDEYQSMQLSGNEYKIAPCERCGHLTVNREDMKDDTESMLPDFWFYIRKGKVSGKKSVCDVCE